MQPNNSDDRREHSGQQMQQIGDGPSDSNRVIDLNNLDDKEMLVEVEMVEAMALEAKGASF